MSANVGTLDRILPIAFGLALLSLVFVGQQTLRGLLGIRTCTMTTPKRA